MKKYELWYREEAPYGYENRAIFDFREKSDPNDGWEKWSLPIGNSYMGVNVFGRSETERLQITENSMYNPPVWNDPNGYHTGLSNFCELYLDFGHVHASTADYRRSLSLNTAIATTEYTCGGIRYQREYFASYPDRVLVVKFTADRAASVTFTARAEMSARFPTGVATR